MKRNVIVVDKWCEFVDKLYCVVGECFNYEFLLMLLSFHLQSFHLQKILIY